MKSNPTILEILSTLFTYFISKLFVYFTVNSYYPVPEVSTPTHNNEDVVKFQTDLDKPVMVVVSSMKIMLRNHN